MTRLPWAVTLLPAGLLRLSALLKRPNNSSLLELSSRMGQTIPGLIFTSFRLYSYHLTLATSIALIVISLTDVFSQASAFMGCSLSDIALAYQVPHS